MLEKILVSWCERFPWTPFYGLRNFDGELVSVSTSWDDVLASAADMFWGSLGDMEIVTFMNGRLVSGQFFSHMTGNVSELGPVIAAI